MNLELWVVIDYLIDHVAVCVLDDGEGCLVLWCVLFEMRFWNEGVCVVEEFFVKFIIKIESKCILYYRYFNKHDG